MKRASHKPAYIIQLLLLFNKSFFLKKKYDQDICGSTEPPLNPPQVACVFIELQLQWTVRAIQEAREKLPDMFQFIHISQICSNLYKFKV